MILTVHKILTQKRIIYQLYHAHQIAYGIKYQLKLINLPAKRIKTK